MKIHTFRFALPSRLIIASSILLAVTVALALSPGASAVENPARDGVASAVEIEPRTTSRGADAWLSSAIPQLAGEDKEDQPTHDVEIHDFYFQPQVVTVTVGAIVRWKNVGATVHTTTSDDDHWTATILPGGEFSVRFLSPGVFGYHCARHGEAGARGSVVVTSQPGPTPTPTQPTPQPSPTGQMPTPSPGGGEIVFDYFANETLRDKTDLFVVQPDGTGRQQITTTSDRAEAQPSWAPGYGQVAYTVSRLDRQGDPWQLAVLDRASGQSRIITAGPEHYEPDWSPDGSRIAYTNITRVGSIVARSEIATIAPDGTRGRTLIRMDSTTYAIINPTWSPDGRRIAFTVGSDYTGGELYVMDSDGRNARRLLSHPGYDDIDPAWSPDGRYITFASGAMRGSTSSVIHSIWLLDVTSGVAGAIAQVPAWDLRRPAWSPDGSEIVFNAQFESDPARWALYVVPSLGGAVRGPLSVGVEPDWGAEAHVLPTPGPLPTMTPTEAVPPTPPIFPTLPTPLPTVPGPSPTIPPPPTFPPPTLEPTPTTAPTETDLPPTAVPSATPTPTGLPQVDIYLPIAHKPEAPTY